MEAILFFFLLVRVVVRMVEDEIRKDDLNPLPAVTPKFVIAVHRRAVGGRIVGRGEGAVLVRIAPEYPVAGRA